MSHRAIITVSIPYFSFVASINWIPHFPSQGKLGQYIVMYLLILKKIGNEQNILSVHSILISHGFIICPIFINSRSIASLLKVSIEICLTGK